MAWNLGHATRERELHPSFARVIEHVAPDALVLNEYVHGRAREAFVAALRSVGLLHVTVTQHIPKQNQLLIATRAPHRQGDLESPIHDECAEANFLHTKLESIGLEIVGFRVPSYKRGRDRDAYWARFAENVRAVASRKIVLLGDMNTDPDSRRDRGALELKALRSEGWSLPAPEGAWSFISKNGVDSSRIDHVLASWSVGPLTSRYVAKVGDHVLAGTSGGPPISDHAALVVEIPSLPRE